MRYVPSAGCAAAGRAASSGAPRAAVDARQLHAQVAAGASTAAAGRRGERRARARVGVSCAHAPSTRGTSGAVLSASLRSSCRGPPAQHQARAWTRCSAPGGSAAVAQVALRDACVLAHQRLGARALAVLDRVSTARCCSCARTRLSRACGPLLRTITKPLGDAKGSVAARSTWRCTTRCRPSRQQRVEARVVLGIAGEGAVAELRGASSASMRGQAVARLGQQRGRRRRARRPAARPGPRACRAARSRRGCRSR